MKPSQRLLCTALLAGAFSFSIAAPAAFAAPPANTPKPQVKRSPVQEARDEVNRCTVNLSKIRASVKSSVETKDEWKAAAGAMDRAKAEYSAAAQPVLDAVREKPEYKSFLEKKQKADTKMAELAKDPQAKPDELTAAATEGSKAMSEMKQMEKDALESDDKVAEANMKLAAARKQDSALSAAVDEACKSNAEYQKAQKEMEAAQAKLKAAEAVPKPKPPEKPKPSTPRTHAPPRASGRY